MKRYLVTGDDGFREVQECCDADHLAETVERVRARLDVNEVVVAPAEEEE